MSISDLGRAIRRDKLLRYLSDPSNPELDRSTLAKQVLGYKDPKRLWIVFTAEQIDDVYREALEIRRKRYARDLMEVDRAMFKKAKEGDPAAGKVVYQFIEGLPTKTQGSLDVNVKDATDEEVHAKVEELLKEKEGCRTKST